MMRPTAPHSPPPDSGDFLIRPSKWRVEVPPNEHPPAGYGIAYYLFDRDAAIALPIPFNVIVGGWRTMVRWLRYPPWRSYERHIEHVRRMAYQDGLADGRRALWFEERLPLLPPNHRVPLQ